MSDAAFPLIQTLTAEEAHAHAAPLGAVLADCVAGGASVNFMHPFSAAQGEAFYREVAEPEKRSCWPLSSMAASLAPSRCNSS
jgi:hypothetical protein